MKYEVVHVPGKNLFITEEEGITAYVEYEINGGSLVIRHTVVPRPIEGGGVAAALVRAACDYALDNDLKPGATCSYATAWLEKNPEYKK